jgi:hypothetical protein
MESKPTFPWTAVVAWIAIVTDLGATALLLFSDAPTSLKLAVTGVQCLGVYTITIWHLGRRHAWHQTDEKIK